MSMIWQHTTVRLSWVAGCSGDSWWAASCTCIQLQSRSLAPVAQVPCQALAVYWRLLLWIADWYIKTLGSQTVRNINLQITCKINTWLKKKPGETSRMKAHFFLSKLMRMFDRRITGLLWRHRRLRGKLPKISRGGANFSFNSKAWAVLDARVCSEDASSTYSIFHEPWIPC